MAVVRFVITYTVVKMRITEKTIHCNPFIALPWTMQLCPSQLFSHMSVYTSRAARSKIHINGNLSLAANKERYTLNAVSADGVCRMASNAEVN